jgi:hypothetical protein
VVVIAAAPRAVGEAELRGRARYEAELRNEGTHSALSAQHFFRLRHQPASPVAAPQSSSTWAGSGTGVKFDSETVFGP